MQNEKTYGDWWHWSDACQCFADEGHAASKGHLKNMLWYKPGKDDAAPDVKSPARPAPPPR
eukprot:9713986-Lingulodinium_polyedra.AAC.1